MTRSLILSATVVAFACGRGGDDASGEESSRAAHVVGAETALVTAGPFVETEDAIGTVLPRPGHVASLSAPAATRVARVWVSVGARVRQGDPLIDFEHPAFDAAAASAEAALVAAQRAAERAQRLADAGVLPRKDAEQAQAELARAQAAAVTARRDRELETMRAPMSGVVIRANATLGASVDPTQLLVEVADPGALDVVVAMSADRAARVQLGATVAFYEGAGVSGNPVATGRVTDVSLAVDSSSRGVPVRMQVVHSARQLRLGENVFARVTVAVHEGALTVPLAALVPDGEGYKVFVVDTGGIARARPVTLGGRTDAVARVIDGLAKGERVVTRGAYGVDDGSRIVPGQP